MSLPQRTKEHIFETASIRRLERCLPDHWLVRHVTERDYGVDCIVEFATQTGDMLGHMIAVQLKSVESLSWRDVDGVRIASISGIKTTTVNYWEGIPMPVFIVVHERATDRLLFSPVNRTVRRKFAALLDQNSISFETRDTWDLGVGDGLRDLLVEAIGQREYPRFAAALLNLIYGAATDSDTLLNALNLDSFMCVEDDVLACYVRVLRQSAVVAGFTGLDWPVRELGFWLEKDEEVFTDRDCLLHNLTFNHAVADLAPHYKRVLDAGLQLVLEEERDFWDDSDPMLIRYCENWEANPTFQQLDNFVRYAASWTYSEPPSP